MNASGKCRTCGAPVRWVHVDESKKRMPIDPDASPKGNVYVVRWDDRTPVVRVVSAENPAPPEAVLLYTSHFATCPNADDWRKKK